MSTALAPQQTDRKAWHDERVGRFTASTFGQLMTEPRSKAARDAGELSETAKTLVAAKAVERLTCVWIKTDETPIMKRGLLLEPGALHILSKEWMPIDMCSWQPYGDNCGATPDGLVDQGRATMDLKCPGNAAEVVRFADEVVDGDFDSLLEWDRDYAWQIMVQALVCGVKTAHLVYFTDRLPVIRLSDEQRDEAQRVIDHFAEQRSQESLYPWQYTLASSGYFYAAKSFTLTNDIEVRIKGALERAEAECLRVMDRYRAILGGTPSPEAVEAVADLLEGQDIETDEQMDVRRLEDIVHHLKDMPWPVELRTSIAQHTVKLVQAKIKDCLAQLEGTIEKDLVG